MFPFRGSVASASIRVGLIAVPVVLWCGAAVRLLAQEAPPETQEQRQAREMLNKGVQDFKNGQYDDAIAAFQEAKQLDARLMNARLYLATAYAAQYIPGGPGEENQELGRKAVEEFRGVLEIDPQNLNAIDGIGSILFQTAGTPYNSEKFEESKSFHQKHIQISPNDPEPYYWVGVIDWTVSFRANNELRARYNEQAATRQQVRDGDLLPLEVRQEYLREYGSIIDEGIESLKHAIEVRPDYDDAMAYLNLLYRRKADTVNHQERDELLKMADDLVDKVKEIKERRVESPRPHGY
jgi:tetratricopeptide (TPR) repeat protein